MIRPSLLSRATPRGEYQSKRRCPPACSKVQYHIDTPPLLCRPKPPPPALLYNSSLQGASMANPSAAGNSYRAARRSTRRDEAVLVTVSGVDARRGPYTEKVSTLTINCHGCKYPS